MATVEYGDRKAQALLAEYGFDPLIVTVYVERYYLPKRRIAEQVVSNWEPTSSEEAATFTQRLSGIILARQKVQIEPPLPDAKVKDLLTSYFDRCKRFENTVLTDGEWRVTRYLDESNLKPDPLHVLTKDEIEQTPWLIEAWGWSPKKPLIWSGGWRAYLDVDDVNLTIFNAENTPYSNPNGIRISANFAPKAWNDQFRTMDWGSLVNGDVHRDGENALVGASATIPWRDGLTLQRLHDQIQEFARIVKPIATGK